MNTNETETYKLKCTCGQIEISMKGEPKVRGYCHCQDCRDLLNIPYHSVNAWEKDRVTIKKGENHIKQYQHPDLTMKKFICDSCGDIVFNSNKMDWRVFSQLLIQKSYGGELPDNLRSKSHFFYARRIVDINDDLPKRD